MPSALPAPADPERLISTAEAAAADSAAERRGLSIDRLMQAAGRAVADFAIEILPAGGPLAVLCGSGNNGGDGYVAAELLAARGRTVALFAAGPPRAEAAARAARRWRGAVQSFADFEPARFAGAIDALFGAGLARPLEGEVADLVRRLNASHLPVLAVDVPSGLSGDSGQMLGDVVRASATISFFRRKPGHLLWPGRGLCGRVHVAGIGLLEEDLAAPPPLFRNGPGLWPAARLRPSAEMHKYQRGHCLVVSGGEFRTGAARLAALAALQAGAGAVTIAGDAPALRVHAAHLTAIMLAEAPEPADFARLLTERRFGALVIGPAAGIGEATRARIAAGLAAGLPMVIDADGLSSLVGHVPMLAAAFQPMVLTPHGGEFARLFEPLLAGDAQFASLPPLLQASKVERTRAAARLSGATILHKGIDTVVATPDGRAAINDNAGPELATVGSGDVLTGLVGAHLAAGLPGFEAAAAAVWLHGRLGSMIGPGLTADRLAAAVRPVWSVVDG